MVIVASKDIVIKLQSQSREGKLKNGSVHYSCSSFAFPKNLTIPNSQIQMERFRTCLCKACSQQVYGGSILSIEHFKIIRN